MCCGLYVNQPDSSASVIQTRLLAWVLKMKVVSDKKQEMMINQVSVAG